MPGDGDVIDRVSGVWARAGKFTVVATARQKDAAALVDRLGGLRPSATWNGRPLGEIDPKLLREHLLVADNDADLFAGTLAEVVSGRRDVDEQEVLQALRTATVDDLVQALPEGLASPIDPEGRNLAGGQRQRVRLARAVLSDPRVLVALEPTSAVDAATEATIIERLVRARRGRTTVVTSTSALVLAHADQVHLMGDGERLIASGTHASLTRDEPAYAALVFRGQAPDVRTIDVSGPR